MKVTFERDFDYSPSAFNGLVTIAYKAGTTATVKRECAEAAIKVGAAREVVAAADAEPEPNAEAK